MRKWVRKPLVQVDGTHSGLTHGTQKPVRIVIHDTESHDRQDYGDLSGVIEYWKKTPDKLGAHIIVDKDGNSAFLASPTKITYAVLGRNTGSVHIELVGFAKWVPKIWWLRISQLNKLAKWIAWLNYEYKIPIRFDPDFGVSGHRDQPKQTHTDPGKGFPMKYVIRKAAQFREKGWT